MYSKSTQAAKTVNNVQTMYNYIFVQNEKLPNGFVKPFGSKVVW